MTENNINKQLFQKEIVFRFQITELRIRMTRNFLIYPSLALFRGFRAGKHDTCEGIVSLFVHTSALFGGNFVLSQNIARMFTYINN